MENMEDEENSEKMRFIRIYVASQTRRYERRWSSSSTRTDPTVNWEDRGGYYDPLTPEEWNRAVGKMLLERSILDTPLNREMFEDFYNIDDLCGQIAAVCIHGAPNCNPFYIHGGMTRYEVRQHEDGFFEAISSQQYNGTF